MLLLRAVRWLSAVHQLDSATNSVLFWAAVNLTPPCPVPQTEFNFQIALHEWACKKEMNLRDIYNSIMWLRPAQVIETTYFQHPEMKKADSAVHTSILSNAKFPTYVPAPFNRTGLRELWTILGLWCLARVQTMCHFGGFQCCLSGQIGFFL